MVESLLPVFANSNFGLVAGGLTDVIIIVGIGMHCVEKSACWGAKSEPESPELVEGLCSCRKFGVSGAAKESRRFLWVATTFGGGTVKESLLAVDFDAESPDPRREPFRAVDEGSIVTSHGPVILGIS